MYFRNHKHNLHLMLWGEENLVWHGALYILHNPEKEQIYDQFVGSFKKIKFFKLVPNWLNQPSDP